MNIFVFVASPPYLVITVLWCGLVYFWKYKYSRLGHPTRTLKTNRNFFLSMIRNFLAEDNFRISLRLNGNF